VWDAACAGLIPRSPRTPPRSLPKGCRTAAEQLPNSRRSLPNCCLSLGVRVKLVHGDSSAAVRQQFGSIYFGSERGSVGCTRPLHPSGATFLGLTRHNTSPMTGAVLTSLVLIPEAPLRRAIEEYVALRPELAKPEAERRCFEEAAMALQASLFIHSGVCSCETGLCHPVSISTFSAGLSTPWRLDPRWETPGSQSCLKRYGFREGWPAVTCRLQACAVPWAAWLARAFLSRATPRPAGGSPGAPQPKPRGGSNRPVEARLVPRPALQILYKWSHLVPWTRCNIFN